MLTFNRVVTHSWKPHTSTSGSSCSKQTVETETPSQRCSEEHLCFCIHQDAFGIALVCLRGNWLWLSPGNLKVEALVSKV